MTEPIKGRKQTGRTSLAYLDRAYNMDEMCLICLDRKDLQFCSYNTAFMVHINSLFEFAAKYIITCSTLSSSFCVD